MKKLVVLVLLIASISFANAQENSINVLRGESDDSQWLQNRVGLYASFFSGYGLSYQHQFSNGISIKTQLFAYGSDDDYRNYNTDEIQLTYGIDLQYNLNRTNNTRFYALLGSFIDYSEDGNYFYSTSPNVNDYDIERYINVGVGFGIEVMAWRNISIVVEGGYFGRLGNNSIIDYDYVNGEYTRVIENQKPRSFGFGAGVGIFYAF